MKTRTAVLVGMILVAAFSRLIPHPWNFTPMTAMALFGAAFLADKRLALFTPMAGLFVSDLGIELLYRLGLMPTWGIYAGMWVQYLALFCITLMGLKFLRRRKVFAIAGTTLAGSVFFFVVTNFGVWAFGKGYSPTLTGLAACYLAGIPFFGNTILGDAFFSTVLFASFALAEKWIPILSEPGVVSATEPVKG